MSTPDTVDAADVVLPEDLETARYRSGLVVGSRSVGQYLHLTDGEYEAINEFRSPRPIVTTGEHRALIDHAAKVGLLRAEGHHETKPPSRFDRLVGLVHRSVGRRLSHPVALGFIGLAALFSLIAGIGMAVGFTFDANAQSAPMVIFVGWSTFYVTAFAHEIAHALVLHHHDRRVLGAGFEFHWGEMSLYVDSSEALFLPRRARMAQSAAGIIGQLAVTAPLAAGALFLPTGMLATEILRPTVIAVALSVGFNALPFLGLDGYWFFGDLFDHPRPLRQAMDELRKLRRRQPASTVWITYLVASSLAAAAMIYLTYRGLRFWYLPLVTEAWGQGTPAGYAATFFIVVPTILAALGTVAAQLARQ